MASKTAWLIEKGSGSDLRYYAPTEPGEWTPDHLKACRFSRREDAAAVQFRHVLHGHLPEFGTRVCDHMWCDGPNDEEVAQSVERFKSRLHDHLLGAASRIIDAR